MPVTPQVSYPGVYVQEVPSGVRTIVGVGTSIAVFIGRTKQGPLDEPVLCLNYSDFERVFSSDYAGSDMARAIRLFFSNGGTQCYAMRIANGANPSEVTLKNESGSDEVLKVTAKSAGLVGETIRLAVTYNGLQSESTFNLEIFQWGTNSSGGLEKQDVEKWQNLSMDPNSSRYVEDFINQNSNLVEISDQGVGAAQEGYSQSGRAVPGLTDPIFRSQWIALMGTTGPIAMGSPWSGTSEITSLHTYTGLTTKTYTFTVGGAGPLTVGTDAIPIDWDDGSGNTGSIIVPDTYVIDDPIPVIEDIDLSFSAGDLVNGEQFTLDAWPTRRFRINVDNGSFVDIDLSGLDFNSGSLTVATFSRSNLADAISTIINSTLPAGSIVTVSFVTGPTGPTGADNQISFMLRILSANGDVIIEPAATNDLAVPLMLGTAQGGLEVSRYAQTRPAPTSVVFDIDKVVEFAQQAQTAFRTLTIDTTNIELAGDLETTDDPTDRMYQDGDPSSVTGNSDGVREKLYIIAKAVNDKKDSDPTFKWSAEVWGSRLALIPGDGGDNSQGSIATSGGDGIDISTYFIKNVRYYSLGTSGTGSFQVAAAAAASDGTAPTLADYRSAFQILDKEVDLFNLMILPADEGHTEGDIKTFWGPASVFCQERRAFLLMDAPASWKTVQEATDPATGVNSLRVGLVKDHSALFYPRITINENGLEKHIGASGAIAGLMARIDGSRGVWKAAAGTEADLRGVVGIEYKFTDGENGILNPRAINTLRIFPNGIVSWGARTMDGDDDFGSEYKYIPVRRLALFMEESLYRGLKWVVFEPNDEPLWAQIRLNVGAFMHNLFRQGAFQGQTPKEAYFVKCDKETTTQNDINLGIVNIWVGFAPLKPAEFVIIYLQQMAGQIEV